MRASKIRPTVARPEVRSVKQQDISPVVLSQTGLKSNESGLRDDPKLNSSVLLTPFVRCVVRPRLARAGTTGNHALSSNAFFNAILATRLRSLLGQSLIALLGAFT